ncbi:MAG: formate dehydrogenase [Hyphomicrobiaceae bacterium]
MKRTEDKNGSAPVADRRNFLKLAGAGAIGAGAAAVTGAPAAATEAAPEAATGYRESEHVKRYYQLARDF